VIGLSIDHVDHISRDMLDLQHADSFLDGNIGVVEAFPKLSAFVDDAIDERLSSTSPPDDVMSTMLFGEINGSRMSRTQVRTLAVNLLSGSSSTTSLLDNLFYRDLVDPVFDARLREDRALIPRAVEESLRLEPPVLFLFRTTLGDTDLSGTPVHSGERICMGIGSANRDEERYADSEEFSIDRAGEPEHLSFGWGGHLCLGIHLARMEAKVALEEWLDLFPAGGVSVAEGYGYQFPKDDFLRYGPERLDIVVSRTTRPV
jgi:cytochrome P450